MVGLAVYVPPHLRAERSAAKAAAGAPTHPAGSSDPGALSTNEAEMQRQRQVEAWGALTRAITGAINRVTLINVPDVAVDLLRVNIIRGRGVFCKTLMRTQQANPELSHVFAALVALVNKELPDVGELLARRLIIMWKRYRRRHEWGNLASTGTFIAHLVGQRVQHHLVLMKMLVTFFCVQPHPSDDEMEAGCKLLQESYKFIDMIDAPAFEVLLDPIRRLLRTSSLTTRSENYLQQLLDEIRNWEPVKHESPAIPPELDLIDPSDQHTHQLDLDDPDIDLQLVLDRFEFDPEFAVNEEAYNVLARSIVGDEMFELRRKQDELQRLRESGNGALALSGGEESKRKKGALIGAPSDNNSDDDDDESEGEELVDDGGDDAGGSKAADKRAPHDPFAFFDDRASEGVRKSVYIAIRSSVSNEEIAHKLLKEVSTPQNDPVIVKMLLETCCQEKMFNKKYNLAAERLSRTSTRFSKLFAELFRQHYINAQSLSMEKLDMVCKFFVPLLSRDTLPWSCMSTMNFQTADRDQRIFIQELWKSLSMSMGMQRLKERLRNDLELRPYLLGLFPFGNVKEARDAISLFGAMDLLPLAEDLQKWLEGEQVASNKRRRDQQEM